MPALKGILCWIILAIIVKFDILGEDLKHPQRFMQRGTVAISTAKVFWHIIQLKITKIAFLHMFKGKRSFFTPL